jgi:LysR family transcriptional regulator, nitrogen assimilation regulatory protein
MLFDFARSTALTADPLLTEDLYAISPPDTGDGDIPLVEAVCRPLIIPGRPHGLRECIERAARQVGVPLNVAAEIDALPQIKMLVERGVGASILSGSAVREEWRRGSLQVRRIVDPGIERTVSLCHLKGRPLTGATEAVRDVLLGLVRDLVSRDLWPGRRWPGLMQPSRRQADDGSVEKAPSP